MDLFSEIGEINAINDNVAKVNFIYDNNLNLYKIKFALIPKETGIYSIAMGADYTLIDNHSSYLIDVENTNNDCYNELISITFNFNEQEDGTFEDNQEVIYGIVDTTNLSNFTGLHYFFEVN